MYLQCTMCLNPSMILKQTLSQSKERVTGCTVTSRPSSHLQFRTTFPQMSSNSVSRMSKSMLLLGFRRCCSGVSIRYQIHGNKMHDVPMSALDLLLSNC